MSAQPIPRTRREALARAHEIRREFREHGEFNVADYNHRVHQELQDFRNLAYDGLILNICETVDRSCTREEAEDGPQQGNLFQMDGEYKLGDGQRVAKRLARLNHAEEAMALDDNNMNVVIKANERKHEELERLRPYWANGRSKAQAVEAYLLANPLGEDGED